MTTVIIILEADGTFKSAYSDDEVEVEVLQRGHSPLEDGRIDEVEASVPECAS